VITSNQINSYGESFSPAEQAQAVGCLREWARHDTWTVNEGLRLLAGIDPHHSQDLTFDSEGFASVSNPSWAKIIEKPGGTWDDATGPRVTGYYLDLTQLVLLGEMLSSWVSRVSHTMQDRHPPRYFIEWASEKGWHPFWLTWAQQAGLFLHRADSQPQAAPVVPAGKVPDTEPVSEPPDWKARAAKRAAEIIASDKKKDLYPSQENIADTIANEFRAAGVVGAGGKPMTGAYIKRHALKGISSEQGRQLSTATRRGK
jgi:hypothetical protein